MNEYEQLRAAAKSVGLMVKKSRRKIKTANDLCGYMLLDEKRNACVHGSRWELTADDVLRICEAPATTRGRKDHQNGQNRSLLVGSVY